MWILVAAASAKPSFVSSTGIDLTINDVSQTSAGIRESLGLAWSGWFATRLAVSGYPLAGEITYSATTRRLMDQNGVFLSISAPRARGLLTAEFTPLRVIRGSLGARMGIAVGGGVIYTVDDLQVIQQEGDAGAELSKRQWHPTVAYGLVGAILAGHHGLELRLERASYVETVDGDELNQNPLLVGAAWTFGPRVQ